MSLSVAEYKIEPPKPTDEVALRKKLLSKKYKAPTKPFGDRILITPIDKGQKEVGGLIIPDTLTSQEGPREGYVSAIGSGAVVLDYGGGVYETRTKTLELRVGDRIFYNYHQAVKMDYPEGDKIVRYEMIHEDQILGIFRKQTGSDLEVRTMWPGWWMHPRGTRVFIEWEEGADTLLDGKLVRTEQSKQIHFTGLVLGFGEKCSADLVEFVEPGKRIFFDQFSQDLMTYNWTHDGKRYGIIRDYDVHCPVPDRLVKHLQMPAYSPAVGE